ncbi:hypothetical protein Hanom_Chr09g00820321 [Helianthus anomalus]
MTPNSDSFSSTRRLSTKRMNDKKNVVKYTSHDHIVVIIQKQTSLDNQSRQRTSGFPSAQAPLLAFQDQHHLPSQSWLLMNLAFSSLTSSSPSHLFLDYQIDSFPSPCLSGKEITQIKTTILVGISRHLYNAIIRS